MNKEFVIEQLATELANLKIQYYAAVGRSQELQAEVDSLNAQLQQNTNTEEE